MHVLARKDLHRISSDAWLQLNADSTMIFDAQDKSPATLETALHLGIALAYERRKGDQSEFWPHLRLLPSEPPSLWLKPTAEQSALYDTLGDCHAEC
jgi:hypothetical protein